MRGARFCALGRSTLFDLRLAPAKGLANRFLRVSSRAVLAGDINHPDFSLNEALGTKRADSLADLLKRESDD